MERVLTGRENNRILAYYLAICMIAMAIFPWGNISYRPISLGTNVMYEESGDGIDPSASGITGDSGTNSNLPQGDGETPVVTPVTEGTSDSEEGSGQIEESTTGTPEVTSENNIEQIPEDNIDQTTEVIVEDSIDQTTEVIVEDSIDQTTEVIVEDNIDQTIEVTPENNTEQTPEVTLEDNIDQTTEVIAEDNVDQTPVASVESNTEQPTVEMPEDNVQQIPGESEDNLLYLEPVLEEPNSMMTLYSFGAPQVSLEGENPTNPMEVVCCVSDDSQYGDYANDGDTITMQIATQENVTITGVIIAGETATVTPIPGGYEATLLLPSDVPQGIMSYTVSGEKVEGETHTGLDNVTGSTEIYFDNIAPTTPTNATLRYGGVFTKEATTAVTVKDNYEIYDVQVASFSATDEEVWMSIEEEGTLINSTTFDKIKVGAQAIDITFKLAGDFSIRTIDRAGNVSAKLKITVEEGENLFEIGTEPTKKVYIVGETLDLTGGTLKFGKVFDDEPATPLLMTDSLITRGGELSPTSMASQQKAIILYYNQPIYEQTYSVSFNIVVNEAGKYFAFSPDGNSDEASTVETAVTATGLNTLQYTWSDVNNSEGTQDFVASLSDVTKDSLYTYANELQDKYGVVYDSYDLEDLEISDINWYWDSTNNMYRSPKDVITSAGGITKSTITYLNNSQDSSGKISFEYKMNSRVEHPLRVTINGDQVVSLGGKPLDWIKYEGTFSQNVENKYVIELEFYNDGILAPTNQNYGAIRNLKFTGDKEWKSFSSGDTIRLESVLGPNNYLYVKGENISGNEVVEISKCFKGTVVLKGIELNIVPNQTVYWIDDEESFTRGNLIKSVGSGELTLIYDKGSEKVPLTGDMIDSFADETTAGIKRIGISYGGFSTYYTVSVNYKVGSTRWNTAKSLVEGNKPVLSRGMVPVKWYEEKDSKGNLIESYWVATTEDDTEWYNYDTTKQIWANVMLRDGLKVREVPDADDVSVTIDELAGKRVLNEGSMFVWIPRFTFSVISWYSDDTIIKFSNGTVDDTSSSCVVNPAFRYAKYNGGNPNLDANYTGPITDLTGFWMAKFEASDGDDAQVAIKADVTSTSNITFSNAIKYSKEMEAIDGHIYGFNTNEVTTHLTKASEWGAVLALTAASKQDLEYPHVNRYYIGKATRTGYTSTSGVAVSSIEAVGKTLLFMDKDASGSTTNNVYGIFDMAGGLGEYVAFIANADTILTHTELTASKDLDILSGATVNEIWKNTEDYRGYLLGEIGTYGSDGKITIWEEESGLSSNGTTQDLLIRGGNYNEVSPIPSITYLAFLNGASTDIKKVGFRPTLLVTESIEEPGITLKRVSISSNNSENTGMAKVDDVITLTIETSSLSNLSEVKINNTTIPIDSKTADNEWNLTYTVKAGDKGYVPFTFKYKKPTDTTYSEAVTTTSDGSRVLIDTIGYTIGTNVSSTADGGAEIKVNTPSGDESTGTGIIKMAWAEGNKDVAFFNDVNNENEIADITSAQKFNVTKAGTYTIYIKDATGNEGVQTVVVSNDVINDALPEISSLIVKVDGNVEATSAKAGNVITLEMTFDKELSLAPTVKVLETTLNSANVVNTTGNTYVATHTAISTSTYTDLPFVISNYQANDKTGVTVTQTWDDGESGRTILYDGTLVAVNVGAPVITTLGQVNVEYEVTFIDDNLVTGSIDISEASGTLSVVKNGTVEVASTQILPGSAENKKIVRLNNVTGEGTVGIIVIGKESGVATVPENVAARDIVGNPNVLTASAQFAAIDTVAPRIESVSIESDNTISKDYAKNGHTITLIVTTHEALAHAPAITIMGETITPTSSEADKVWTATYTILAGENSKLEGKVAFTISNCEDLAGNILLGTKTQADYSDSVIYDRTLPTISVDKNGGSYKDTKVIVTLGDDRTGVYNNTIDVAWTNSPTTPITGWISETLTAIKTVELDSPKNIDGKMYLHIKSIKDNANNESIAFNSNAFNFDNTAPTVTFTPNEGVAEKSHSVTIAVVDPTVGGVTSGLKSSNVYQYAWSTSNSETPTTWNTFTPGSAVTTAGLADGTWYLWVNTLQDNVGNVLPAVKSGSFVVDNTKPIVNVTSFKSNNTNTKFAKNGDTVTVTFTTSEEVTTPTVTISGRTATVTGSGTSWSASYLIPSSEASLAEGLMTFAISGYEDSSHNGGANVTQTATLDTVTYDRVNPTISVDKNGGTYRNVTVTVTLSGTGTVINGNEIQYVWNDSITPPATGWISAPISSNQATIYSDTNLNASKYLIIKSVKDMAGNESGVFTSAVFNFDNTAPTVTFTPNEGVAEKSHSVTIAVVDPTVGGVTSGLKSSNVYQYAWSTSNSETPTTWNTFTPGSAVTTAGLADGTWYLWVNTLQDNVGNVLPAVKSGSFVVDNTKPIVNVTSFKSNNTNTKFAKNGDTVTVTFTTSEEVTTPTVTISGRTATVTGSGTSWSASYLIPSSEASLAEGLMTFAISGYEDSSHNGGANVTQTATSDTVTYDRVKPTISVDKNGGIYRNVTVIVTLSGTGTVINGNEIQYVWNDSITPPATGWISAPISSNQATIYSDTNLNASKYLIIKSVKDMAGNESGVFTSAVFNFDNTAPTVTFTPNEGVAEKSHSVIIAVVDPTVGGVTSGLKSSNIYQYAWSTSDTVIPATWNTFTPGSAVTTAGLADGTWHLWVNTLQDNVGNVLPAVKSGSFVVDNTAPTITFTPNAEGTPALYHDVLVTIIDPVVGSVSSGMSSDNVYKYGWSTSNLVAPLEWTDFAYNSQGNTIRGDSKNGTYYLWINAVKDNANNSTSAISSGAFVFDENVPLITVDSTITNSTDTAIANNGNTITINMTSNKPLQVGPTVVIICSGTTRLATVIGSGTNWTATYVVPSDETTWTNNSAVGYNISGYKCTSGYNGQIVYESASGVIYIGSYNVTLTKNIAEAATLTGDGAHAVGGEVTIVATVNTGYRFDRWIPSGITFVDPTLTTQTFTMPANEVHATANFVKTWNVTFTNDDDTVLKQQVVDNGTAAIAPENPSKSGYNFTGWDKEFSSVTSDLTVKATYSKKTYTITATAGINGTISPAGEVTAGYGSNKTFSITPANGYEIEHVYVDGSLVEGEPSTYTFTSIVANHSINATFVRNRQYEVSGEWYYDNIELVTGTPVYVFRSKSALLSTEDASAVITINASTAKTISFDYILNAESNARLGIKINGEKVVYEENSSSEWNAFTGNYAPKNGIITIGLSYSKGTTASELDLAAIKNLIVE